MGEWSEGAHASQPNMKEENRWPALQAPAHSSNVVLLSYAFLVLFSLVDHVLGTPDAPIWKVPSKDWCKDLRPVSSFNAGISMKHWRRHHASIVDFGGIGDGVTLNTLAFQRAVSNLSSFSKNGGVQLNVPAGKWLTGSFNLTSHFTLFLHKDAVILGSQDPKDWPIIDPLPSYGRGRELPGGRHISLLHGEHLKDVVITGDNGTIDGQGAVWWSLFLNGSLDYTRGHLLELSHSKNIIISNLTFRNSPFWNIHPVYCRHVLIQNLTILAPAESKNTDGIDPDSSKYVCIEDCYIDVGDDLIAIKSGWDEYGIAYGRPSSHIVIRRITGATRASSGIALGSEMSGGISDVYVDDVVVNRGGNGIRVKSALGRGGYVKHVFVSNVILRNVKTGIALTGLYGDHPDDNYDPNAFPDVQKIFIKNVIGYNITLAGNFQGLSQRPYRKIYLQDILLHINSTSALKWNCSFISGYASAVAPHPCPSFRIRKTLA